MTREELIILCVRGVVQVGDWHDRDSAGAQRQLGEALALLRAGCEFRPANSPEDDASTIWIRISFPGFNAFEHGPSDRAEWDNELFYIPTTKRLEREGDWY